MGEKKGGICVGRGVSVNKSQHSHSVLKVMKEKKNPSLNTSKSQTTL